MKKLLYFIFLSFNFLPVLFSQNWQWAKNISFTYTNPGGTCLAADNNANFYLSTNFNSAGPCLAKFNSQGNELWRKYFANLTGGLTIKGITSSSNYVYMTGGFSGTLQIGTSNLISNGWQDIFVACYDSNGNFVWANNYGGPTDDCGNGICSDVNGNIYLTGSYSDTAKFGTSNLICQCNSNMYGNSNMFMVKTDPTGNILLLKSAGTKDTTAFGSSGAKIKTDSSGNIFIIGWYSDLTLDTFHLVGHGSYFLCRLDSLGNTMWIKETGDSYHPTFDIAFDYSGNIIITGNAEGNHESNIMTKKYNLSGQLVWDARINGVFYDGYGSNSVATDGSNSFIVGSARLYYSGRSFLLLAQYDSLGATVMLDTIYVGDGFSGNLAIGESIIRDSNGDFIISGIMTGNFKLGFDSLSTTNKEVFIAKFKGSNFTGISENGENSVENKIYPNPSSGIFTVDIENINAAIKIRVYDVLGNCLWNKECQNEGKQKVDLSYQPKGIYFVKLTFSEQVITKKIILD